MLHHEIDEQHQDEHDDELAKYDETDEMPIEVRDQYETQHQYEVGIIEDLDEHDELDEKDDEADCECCYMQKIYLEFE